MGLKKIFDLSLPEGSSCTSMAIFKHNVSEYIIAAFEVPDIGIQVYILNPNDGTSRLLEYNSK